MAMLACTEIFRECLKWYGYLDLGTLKLIGMTDQANVSSHIMTVAIPNEHTSFRIFSHLFRFVNFFWGGLLQHVGLPGAISALWEVSPEVT